MKFRAAVFYEKGKPLAVEEVESPPIGPDEVLVKQFSSGICHSQLHQILNPTNPMPMIMGHESTGVVVAKGRNVTHVKEGDHVMVTWIPRDGDENWPKIRPQGVYVNWRGQQAKSTNVYTWAEATQAHHQYVVKMPNEFPTDVTAIIGCAVMTGAGAVMNTAKVKRGDSVAVIGVGGVGLSSVAAAAALGANPVIAVDLDEAKLEFARKFGATHGVNASSGDPVEAIRKLTSGGVDFAFDTIGAPKTQVQIAQATRPGIGGVREGGTAVLVGIPQTEVTVDLWRTLVAQARIYRSSLGGSSRPDRDFPIFLDWYKRGQLKLNDLVTKKYTLDQINEGVHDLERGRIFGRSIMEFAKP
ncbi:MAG: alcohol dehydrogenase [Dehalococcoidia bacterium]|nr:alcohol dehydrogenase [Dehalococcoidia bacterium]